MRHPHARFPIAAFALVAVFLRGTALAIDITTCDQLVPDGEIGVLQASVVCSASGGFALAHGGTLQLNGHTVTAESPTPGQVGISCLRGRCRIQGPGAVRGFKGAGILGLAPSTLQVSTLTVRDNGIGISGDKVRLDGVDVSQNDAWGVDGRKLDASHVTCADNLSDGLSGSAVRLIDVAVSGNVGNGVNCNRVTAKRLTTTDNAQYGVRSVYHGTMKLTDSNASGNRIADIGSQHRPKLVNTWCNTSLELTDGGATVGTWGVCNED